MTNASLVTRLAFTKASGEAARRCPQVQNNAVFAEVGGTRHDGTLASVRAHIENECLELELVLTWLVTLSKLQVCTRASTAILACCQTVWLC